VGAPDDPGATKALFKGLATLLVNRVQAGAGRLSPVG
jgi:hypothetical protein